MSFFLYIYVCWYIQRVSGLLGQTLKEGKGHYRDSDLLSIPCPEAFSWRVNDDTINKKDRTRIGRENRFIVLIIAFAKNKEH